MGTPCVVVLKLVPEDVGVALQLTALPLNGTLGPEVGLVSVLMPPVASALLARLRGC